jgi:peptide deformylase
MAILPILTFPHPLLQKKALKITDPQGKEIQRLILDMLDTMKNAKIAVGLAAPQVGQSVRLCIIKVDGQTYILINPQIKAKSWRKSICEEGCLSFPGNFIPVKRSAKVSVLFQNEDGKEVMLKGAEGLLARALQHEIDHLDGILYTSKEVKIKK